MILIPLGLLGGVITAVSPCVLPVLPVLLAGGASGRKPLRIIAGLIASFTVFTLFATWLLDELGLPDDLLRNLAIAFLFVLAVVLLVPQLGVQLERGLAVFSRFRPANAGGGFGLGVALGLVFVPCAGPVLAAISTAAAKERFGLSTVVLTICYAIGAAVPMLVVAYGGRGASNRINRHAAAIRTGSGVLVAAVALAFVFHLDDHLTSLHVPGLQHVENSLADTHAGKTALAKVTGNGKGLAAVHSTRGGLPDYGPAPSLHAGGAWINSKPLTLRQLRGKVVLVDFWTYSCINCLRTLPHLKAWYAAYHKRGFVIIGVHTPEFAFEHVTSNVQAAVKRLGITYPVMQDNAYKTWDAYANEYWPAEYLIDKAGDIVHTSFGEGEYDKTESLIRRLLHDTGAHARYVANTTPTGVMTPESYLGYARLTNYAGRNPLPNAYATYAFPAQLPANTLAYAGRWKIGAQAITAGPGAKLRLHFEAKDVYLVAGGHGTITATIDGKPAGVIHVRAERLYTVRASSSPEDALLELRFSPGVQGYSFTFG